MQQSYTLSKDEVQAAVQQYVAKEHKLRGLSIETISSTEEGGVTFSGVIVPVKRAPRKAKAGEAKSKAKTQKTA